MKRKLKISFIGAGFMAQIAHICNFKKNNKVQLWDIADYDHKMAAGVKKKFGFKGIATKNAETVMSAVLLPESSMKLILSMALSQIFKALRIIEI